MYLCHRFNQTLTWWHGTFFFFIGAISFFKRPRKGRSWLFGFFNLVEQNFLHISKYGHNNLHCCTFDCFERLLSTQLTTDLALECSRRSKFRSLFHIDAKNCSILPKHLQTSLTRYWFWSTVSKRSIHFGKQFFHKQVFKHKFDKFLWHLSGVSYLIQAHLRVC